MGSEIRQSNRKKEKRSSVIVACRVMEPELECLRDLDSDVDICYLDQGLHWTPDRMAAFFSLRPCQGITQEMFLDDG